MAQPASSPWDTRPPSCSLLLPHFGETTSQKSGAVERASCRAATAVCESMIRSRCYIMRERSVVAHNHTTDRLSNSFRNRPFASPDMAAEDELLPEQFPIDMDDIDAILALADPGELEAVDGDDDVASIDGDDISIDGSHSMAFVRTIPRSDNETAIKQATSQPLVTSGGSAVAAPSVRPAVQHHLDAITKELATQEQELLAERRKTSELQMEHLALGCKVGLERRARDAIALKARQKTESLESEISKLRHEMETERKHAERKEMSLRKRIEDLEKTLSPSFDRMTSHEIDAAMSKHQELLEAAKDELANRRAAKRQKLVCMACEDRPRTVVNVPCGHREMCEACADKWDAQRDAIEGPRRCATCSAEVERRIKVFDA